MSKTKKEVLTMSYTVETRDDEVEVTAETYLRGKLSVPEMFEGLGACLRDAYEFFKQQGFTGSFYDFMGNAFVSSQEEWEEEL